MKKRLRTRLPYHVPLFIFLVTLLLVQSASTQDLKPTDVGELAPGPYIERELAGGNSHSYRVRLTAKQYLKVVVNQKG